MHARLLWSLLAAALALNAVYGAVAGVLVPAQIARANTEDKDLILGVVLTASSLLTLVVRPLAGAASDRTRSRWGRRTPWLLAGATASAVIMVALGFAESVWAVALGWLLLQPALNTLEAPLDAILADRVDADRRPRATALFGAGAATGVAAGVGLAGLGVSAPAAVYTALAVTLLVVAIAFVAINPDRTTVPVAPPVPTLHAWANADMRRVFAARFVLVLGHQMVMGYMLYIVMHTTGLPVDDAGGIVSLVIGVHIVSLVAGAVTGALRIRRRVPWIIGSSAVLAVALLMPAAVPGVAGLLAYAVVGGVARGVYLSADLALMILLPSGADSGRDLGVFGLATIVPQVLAPALAGLVLYVSGGLYTLLFVLASVAALASIPFIAYVAAKSSSRP